MEINGDSLNNHRMTGQKEVGTGSGAIVAFQQNVEYYYTGSGLLVEFRQNVMATGSGSILGFCQNVE